MSGFWHAELLGECQEGGSSGRGQLAQELRADCRGDMPDTSLTLEKRRLRLRQSEQNKASQILRRSFQILRRSSSVLPFRTSWSGNPSPSVTRAPIGGIAVSLPEGVGK